MKNFIFAFLMIALSIQATAKQITIPKNADGGWYKPSLAGIAPGDTIIVTSDLAYVYFDGLKGAPDKPIVIRNKGGKFVIGYNNASEYGICFVNSRYIVLDGSGDAANKYGLVFYSGSTKTVSKDLYDKDGKYVRTITGYKGSGIITGNTSDIEVKFNEITMASAGIFGNPPSGVTMYNVSIHDNYIHNIKNGQQETAEGMYLGNTAITVVKQSAHYENLNIYNNLLEDLGGDGIQIACADGYKIYKNTITDFGNQNFSWQQTGILAGGQTKGTITGNLIQNGTGTGIQLFGYDTNNVVKNRIIKTSTAANQDAIYIDKRNALDGGPLVANIIDNVIDGAARDGIRQATTAQNGNPGNWTGNTVSNVKGSFLNGGVVGFTSTPVVTPPPVVVPPVVVPPVVTPPATKKVLVIYDNGTWEFK